MGFRDTFRKLFGAGDGGPGDPAVPAPPVSELLAPNAVMEKEWRRVAREDAREFGDMTRSELGREFGAKWFAGQLPAAGEERRSAVEEKLVGRSRSLYAEHVDQVQAMFDLPDAQVRSGVMTEIDVLPGRDRPLERAMAISGAILADEATDRHMDQRAREVEEEGRMSSPTSNDWLEHRAGEPAVLAAERDGDYEHADRARRSYYDGFQLKDPTLREIAMTVVEKSDAWDRSDASDLATGQIRLEAATADRVRLSATAYEPGRRRDATLVEAYLEDCAARNPKVVEQWNRQALEVMSEGPAFMRSRYGAETDGMSVRQVVSLETMRSVAAVRESLGPGSARDLRAVRDVSPGDAQGSGLVRAASITQALSAARTVG
jgi:hypothetical protein